MINGVLKSFEGVCVNYRHPDPRRGEPRVGSAPDVAFPVDPVDPVDPVQNSVRLKNLLFLHAFGHFWPELRTSFCTKYVQISFFHKKSKIHRFLIEFFWGGAKFQNLALMRNLGLEATIFS